MRARQNKEMALQNKICVGCSKQFEGRPNAKACSSKCRKRFFRARQAVKQEVEKLAQLRDEIKQDIHGSLSLPQMVPVAADDDTGNSGLENFVDDQPEFMDSLNSSEVVTEAPVEEPIYSQPPIIPLEPLPPAPDKWEQLQNSWQTPPAAPAPAQTAPEQVPAPKTMPVQTLSPLESLPAAAPALLETTPYEAPTLENAPMMPINSLETTTAAPKSPILANWFKNKPFAVTLAFVVLISLASGIFAITGLMRQSPAGEDGLSLQQDTTDDSLLNVKDAKLTLNLDTTIVTKLGIGIVPTGDASLQVTGDIQSTATIFASGGGSSLNNAGLTINNVVVCTAAGCASNVAGATVLLQNAVLGTRQVGNIYISGTVTAGSFSGSGTGLTGVNAAKLEGNTASFFTNASNLSSGTLSDARLSSNVSLLGQTIDSGEILDGTITNIDIAAGAAIAYAKLNLASSIVSADITDGTLVNADIGATAAIDWSKISKAGSSLADLTTRSASDLTSGTLAIARGGTGAGTAQAAIDNLSGLTTTGDLLYYDGANSTRLARGANGNCLQSSAVSIAWVACAGLINLQNAYDNGNTITTSDARNITLTYADTATDSNLTISTATGSTGFTTISRADGAGAADPAQLLLIDNLDLDRAQPIGLKLQSAAGALTTAIDATDDQIVTALAIGSNTITTTSTTIAATELDLLDGRDTQLVDTTDAVVTAIVGTGTLTTGALGAGFTAVAVGQGGTGATTFTANGVLYGNTTAAVGVTAAGTTGQCLSGNTGAAPTWVACTGLITLQNAYDNDGDGSDSIIAQTSADDGLIFRNPDLGSDSNYILTLDQLATTGTHGGLSIQSAGSGNLLLITDTTATARDVLTIANGGAATFRNQTDSATGFQIQDADGGTPIFNVDTGNEWVGLGTASPGSLLDMVASSTAGILQITNTNTAGYASIDFFNNSDVMQGNVGYANASVASSFLQNSIYFGSNTDIPIVLQTGSTERVRVHAGGNVGIGTSTPTNLLDVAGNTLIGTRGSEKVANGDFSTHAPSNCNGWTLGADWACDIVSNEVDNTGAGTTTLEQNVSSVAGETYVVSFTVKNRTAGTVTPQVGGVSGSAVSSNTAASQLIVATGTGNLIFTPNAAFDGSIDDASVKKLTGGDLSVYGNGLFKPATDSTTAFQIQNAAGTSNLLVADTTNTRIGLGTASPTELLTVAGNIKIGKRTDSGGTTSDWSKASQATAGTIAEDGGATSSIDGADVMAVYNGSLYVGSGKEGAAEVYRYDGGTSWTKVSQATAGTIAEDGGATTGIDYVDSMVVYNGYLYIGTYESEGSGGKREHIAMKCPEKPMEWSLLKLDK